MAHVRWGAIVHVEKAEMSGMESGTARTMGWPGPVHSVGPLAVLVCTSVV